MHVLKVINDVEAGYAESDSSSAFRIKLYLKIDVRFWGKGKNGVLVGKPFEAVRYLKVPVSFRARSRIFKITENLAHYRAHPSSQTSPFCFVNWYIYCFIFKTVEALRLNTNTTNLKRLSGPVHYRSFWETGPKEENQHQIKLTLWRHLCGWNLGHIGGRRLGSLLRYPCSPY